MRNKFRNKAFIFILAVFLAAIFIFVYLIGILIPRQMESILGPSGDNLEISRRILYSARLFLNLENLISRGDNKNDCVMIIKEGKSASEIASDMEKRGVIKDSKAFADYLIYKGIDKKIQAGAYRISTQMNAIEIAELIYDDTPEDITFSFLPGWRAEEIAALIPHSGFSFSSEDFLEAVNSEIRPEINGSMIELASIEGFMFPGTYDFDRDAGPHEITNQFVERFLTQIPADYFDVSSKRGLNPLEAVTLASIVQKEMVLEEEAGLIASVFLNRMEAGMPLQSDPTVQYAIGYSDDFKTWWKTPLGTRDLQIDSPFNTYINPGLPPAPICNPGTEALLGVINPEETDYFYFRMACDGSGRHIFSKTYEQHLDAVCH